MDTRQYIKVILPLRLEWEPCYYLPGTGASVRTGDRIKVSFARKWYIGVVSETGVTPGIDPSKVAPAGELDTGLSPVSSRELEFWRFLSSYYLCTLGEVYKAAYPLPRLASEEVQLRAAKRRDLLLEKEIALWQNRIHKLEPRLEAKLSALNGRHSESVRARLCAERDKVADELAMARARLASLSGDIFTSRAQYGTILQANVPDSMITNALKNKKPVLFKSSDRTATYLNLILEYLKRGKNALLLVPEISLAESLRKELEEVFGKMLLVHHSGASAVRRRKISDHVRSGEPYVVLGTRSSIFLPFCDLGIVLVDGEQSAFYKQSEGAPRYNARDAAIVLAGIHGAGVLLGSSSPSLESLLNTRTGRYTMVDKTVDGSYHGTEVTVDTGAERKKNGMFGCISKKLYKSIADCLQADRGNKVAIIRGFEKEEEAAAQLDALFKERIDRFHIFSIPEAQRSDLSDYQLIALLSAEAMFKAEDFRGDERAFQFLDKLRGECGYVMVQTSGSGHQVFSMKSAEPLLEERRRFALPPYTRIVDVILPARGDGPTIGADLSRNLRESGFNVSDTIPRADGKSVLRVVFKREKDLVAKKKALAAAIKAFGTGHKVQGIILDVDPL